MKKIFSIVLALVLVCGIAVTAMAANVNVSVEPDAVGIGDTVTVTVTLDEEISVEAGSTVVQGQVHYDGDILSYVGGNAGEGYEYLTIVKHARLDRINLNYLSMTNPQVPVALPAGTVAVLTFTAQEVTTVTDMDISVSLVAQDLSGKDTLAKVEAEVTVTVCPNHNPTETVVEGSCISKGYTIVGCEECGTTIIEGDYNTDNHGQIVHVEAKEPGCFEEGNIEHWYCTDCGATWTDEALTEVSNQMNVKIGPTHALEHVEAVEPGCDYDGNIEYWYCTECGYAYLDELGWYPTNLYAVILPHTGHTVEHVEAKEPGCFEEGNIEHWYCTVCGATWLDEECTVVSNQMSVKLGVAHSIEHVEAKEPTCYEEGNIEYWYCTECGYAWLDEYLHQNTNLMSVSLPVTHSIEHVEAVECTCWEDGNIEYWYCTECGYAWLDEYLHLNTNLMSVVLPCTGHSVEHVEAKDPTCYEEGNVEYWYCTCCGYAWLDEDCTVVTNLMSVKLGVCHSIVHVEAVEPTSTENGNIEYWYCTECGYAWLDENCTRNTNLLSVILPATGEDNVGDDTDPGDFSTVMAVAAAVISLTGAVALPVVKNKLF